MSGTANKLSFCMVGTLMVLMADPILGQQLAESVTRDTTLFTNYTGEIKMKGIRTDTGFVMHGPVSFASRVLNLEAEQTVKKLDFTGAYVMGKRNGSWQFNEATYNAIISGVQRTRTTVGLAYNINGSESSFDAKFSGGIAQGKWAYSRNTIRDGRIRKVEEYGAVEFNRGVAVGRLNFQEVDHTVDLALNSSGFLNGTSVLRYKVDDMDEWIREERDYQDGLLLELRKYHDRSDTPLTIVDFQDVRARLLADNSEADLASIAEDGFGIHFDNGYTADDRRTREQLDGNAIVESTIEQFTKYLKHTPKEQAWPDFKLTRRFIYTYPEDDPARLEELQQLHDSLCTEIAHVASSAGLRLYERDANSIILAMAFTEKALEKCTAVGHMLDQINAGDFTHRYRPSYFGQGVRGLNAPDSVVITGIKNDTLVARFPGKDLVDSPDSLIQRTLAYMEALARKHQEIQRNANRELRHFTEQEVVDSLDQVVYRNELISDSLLQRFSRRTRDTDISNMTFHDKVFIVLKKNQVPDLKKRYVAAEQFMDKLEFGRELECFYTMIIDDRERLKAIAEFQSGLDSLFTLFVENPFDTRYFESRILNNVKEKAGRRLIDHYTNEILQAKSCMDAQVALDKIESLQALLMEVAKKHNDAEVIELNRALRRETVPSRIERMLGLQN